MMPRQDEQDGKRKSDMGQQFPPVGPMNFPPPQVPPPDYAGPPTNNPLGSTVGRPCPPAPPLPGFFSGEPVQEPFPGLPLNPPRMTPNVQPPPVPDGPLHAPTTTPAIPYGYKPPVYAPYNPQGAMTAFPPMPNRMMPLPPPPAGSVASAIPGNLVGKGNKGPKVSRKGVAPGGAGKRDAGKREPHASRLQSKGVGKKKRRGRPPNPANSRKSVEPNRKSTGKARQRPLQPRKSATSQAGGGNTRKRRSSGPEFQIVSDEQPDRLVNPLIEIPSEASQSEPVVGGELITVTDIAHHRPDTYPLSYLGRLLGFDLEVPDKFARGSSRHTSDALLTTRAPPPFPTPLPDIDKLPLKKPDNDLFLQVPPEGPPMFPYRAQQRSGRSRTPNSTLGDEDDQRTLDQMDPVYAALLKKGFDKGLCKPTTSVMANRFVTRLKTIKKTLPEVQRLAHSLHVLPAEKNGEGNINGSWTFEDWMSCATDSTERPRWLLDRKKVYAVPPPQSFGIIARFNDAPVAMLHYKFQWYPMTSSESELVLAFQGVEPCVGTETVASETPPPAPKNPPPTPATESAGEQQAPTTKVVVEKDEQGKTYASKDCRDGNPQAPTEPAEQSKETTQPHAVTAATASEKASEETTTPKPESLPGVEINDTVRLILICLALEHARACDVWYSLWDAPEALVELITQCFRMVKLPFHARDATSTNTSSPTPTKPASVPMVCDLKKCSSRYALLRQKELLESPPTNETEQDLQSTKERILMMLPTMEEAKSCFDAEFAEMQRAKRAIHKTPSRVFVGATGQARAQNVGVRAMLSPNPDAVKLARHSQDDNIADQEMQIPDGVSRLPQLDILRCFPIPQKPPSDAAEIKESEIFAELLAKQRELVEAERTLEPRIRGLMGKVVSDRWDYEQPDEKLKRAQERRLLQQNEKIVAQRKERDQAWQDQLEQDMNAVCNICNDGEVTPDNQILFCESCNVAVHQMCYGIEKVPEGDYYCIACRFFGRDKMIQNLAQRNSSGPRTPLTPLPITCELCPVKQGAYIRTDTSKSDPALTITKWVHMACAKWQGLPFVDKAKPEMVEDISQLKKYFRRLDMSCAICEGKRGAYHNCRHEGCEKWLHITCARAVGVCQVIHGEDVEGPVAVNPWSLMCPEHSDVNPEDLAKQPTPVEQLVRAAKQFPVEPMPEPEPQPHKPFNKLNGKERKKALADTKYENDFLEEIMTKKMFGLRCEVCDTVEEDGKNLSRCSGCNGVICVTCRLSEEKILPEQKSFKCFNCHYVQQKEKANEERDTPYCRLCNKKTGLLLPGFAKPVNRLSYWKHNDKEFKRALYAQDLWVHYACAFWLKGLDVISGQCEVDLSNVVMSNGKGFVRASTKCMLCGLGTGLKAKCADQNCRARGERRQPYSMHVSCARQAGFEVQHEDEKDPPFYVNCYFHGGCEYTFRAQLEDLIEIEKRRAGKRFGKSDAPMTFSDGSRLLHQAIVVMATLGWSWRWAEFWVEYGSNWEPLIEKGQKEENMTKAQLKIVESSPESRATDARRCRLAALGAALRNRGYDQEDGFDNESLNRALQAVLRTKSLVGPLQEDEIDFFVDWLSRAYRSKSKNLGYGEDSIKVATDGSCIHIDDKSPKYKLGQRPIPGKVSLAEGEYFESNIQEPDDFLKPELADGKPMNMPLNCLKAVLKKKMKYKNSDAQSDEEGVTLSPRKVAPPAERLPSKSQSQERHPKKRRRSQEQTTPRAHSAKAASVAAVVPSAVKRRGPHVEPRRRPPPLPRSPPMNRSPKRSKRGLNSPSKRLDHPVLEASVVYDTLPQSKKSKLRQGRRGRPPITLDMAVMVKLDGSSYLPEGENRTSDGTEGMERDATHDVSEPVESKGETPQPVMAPAITEAMHVANGSSDVYQDPTDSGNVQATAEEGSTDTPHGNVVTAGEPAKLHMSGGVSIETVQNIAASDSSQADKESSLVVGVYTETDGVTKEPKQEPQANSENRANEEPHLGTGKVEAGQTSLATSTQGAPTSLPAEHTLDVRGQGSSTTDKPDGADKAGEQASRSADKPDGNDEPCEPGSNTTAKPSGEEGVDIGRSSAADKPEGEQRVDEPALNAADKPGGNDKPSEQASNTTDERHDKDKVDIGGSSASDKPDVGPKADELASIAPDKPDGNLIEGSNTTDKPHDKEIVDIGNSSAADKPDGVPTVDEPASSTADKRNDNEIPSEQGSNTTDKPGGEENANGQGSGADDMHQGEGKVSEGSSAIDKHHDEGKVDKLDSSVLDNPDGEDKVGERRSSATNQPGGGGKVNRRRASAAKKPDGAAKISGRGSSAVISSPADERRRSSRHSRARIISYKEPGDAVNEFAEDDVPRPKRKRSLAKPKKEVSKGNHGSGRKSEGGRRRRKKPRLSDEQPDDSFHASGDDSSEAGTIGSQEEMERRPRRSLPQRAAKVDKTPTKHPKRARRSSRSTAIFEDNGSDPVAESGENAKEDGPATTLEEGNSEQSKDEEGISGDQKEAETA